MNGRFGQIVGRHLRQVRVGLAVAALCTLGVAITELLRPWPLKIIFDHILMDRPLPSYLWFVEALLRFGKVPALVVTSFTTVLIALLGGSFAYLQLYITSRVGSRIVYTLRRELFGHLQGLSLSFHSRARSGELLTKLAGDTSTVKEIFSESALAFSTHLLNLVGTFAIMLFLNWKLALIILLTFPVFSYNLFYLYRRARNSARRQRKKEEKIAARISQALSTISLVQAFGRERYEEERFETESSGYMDESVRNARIEAAAARMVEVVSALGMWAVVLFGSLQVLSGKMTLGAILIFASYLRSLYRPIRHLAHLSTRLAKAMVSAQRIEEILLIEPDIRDDVDAIEASNLRGEIVVDHVSFDYGDGKEPLKDVSFRVSAGQRVALVGASGAGKSTVVSLMLRLYDPQVGAIFIDGIDIKRYNRASLRREIGIVLQESTIFGASIKENIAYGKLDASMEEIVAAARAANAHEFIMKLEHGYDTIIGERGETISGGERRRIAIARALIRNAPILILDEPMAGLDVENEAKVWEALDRLTAGKTSLLITHHLRVLGVADLVLVLEDGRIVERGTHRELLGRNSDYRRRFDLATSGHPPRLELAGG